MNLACRELGLWRNGEVNGIRFKAIGMEHPEDPGKRKEKA